MAGRWNLTSVLDKALDRQKQEAIQNRQLANQEQQTADSRAHNMVVEELAKQEAVAKQTNADRVYEQEKQQTANSAKMLENSTTQTGIAQKKSDEEFRPIEMAKVRKELHPFLNPRKDGTVTASDVDKAETLRGRQVDDQLKNLQILAIRKGMTAADVAAHKELLAEKSLQVEGHVNKLLAGMNIQAPEAETSTNVLGVKAQGTGAIGANLMRSMLDKNWMKGNTENRTRMTKSWLGNLKQIEEITNNARSQGVPINEDTKENITLALGDISLYKDSEAMSDPLAQETLNLAGSLTRSNRSKALFKMVGKMAEDNNRIVTTAENRK